MKEGQATPWGPAQTVKVLAEGITHVTTAGHGGILLNEARWQEFLLRFPTFEPFTGRRILEEDCDAVFAYIAFPAICDDRLPLDNAKDYARKMYGGMYAELVDNPPNKKEVKT